MRQVGALTRYHLELLVRSHGWLPPFLAFALLLVIGVTAGDPLLGGLGYGAGLLVPVSAWYVRGALTAEPPASRACLVAVAGPARVHLGALLAALTVGLLLAVGEVAVLWWISGAVANPGAQRDPGVGPAVLAGLTTSVVCVLLGVLAGALGNRPVLVRGPYGILATLGLAAAALVVPVSPANAALGGVVTAARTGQLAVPWGELLLAVALFVVGGAGVAALAGRRPE
ncbi:MULTISPECIES: ABC transporter [Kitasatospora]|uniref:ABC transporter n=1 Tax=Kitasatospora cathayae TaxID=3004092 RepID=A0ABY7Q3V2_9ACTN|nr:ABC transporter [Kitasatospora sp. HUAS 3-15]WBP87323.1 ABC transporter [Kitasatospora sp. HUAS 3-15]